MVKFYFINNKLLNTLRDIIIDPYVLLRLRYCDTRKSINEEFEDSNNLDLQFNTVYASFKSNGLINLEIDALNKELVDFTIVSINSINIFDEQWYTNLLNRECTIALWAKDFNILYTTNVFNIYKNVIINLYNDALALNLEEGIPYYLFHEQQAVALITDREFNVLSIVFFNLSKDVVFQIKEYLKFNKVECHYKINSEHNTNEQYGYPYMSNSEILIKKIFDLNNINLWDVVYYGLHRFLVDKAFCLRFAEEYLTRNSSSSSFVIELAGLSKNKYSNEYDQVFRLMDLIVEDKNNVMLDQGQLYNKVWFYLTLAVDMKELNVIE